MKKRATLWVFFIVVVFALSLWTISCQSPSSSNNPSSSRENSASDSSKSGTGSDSKASMGLLTLIIKDAPIENAEQVLLTIDKIRVHQACETEEACWVTVWENEAGTEYDLLLMETTPLVFTTALAAGKYNQIRFSILSGRLFLLGDTTEHPLDVPSDEVKIHYQFEVPAGGTAQITLDFSAEESLHIVQKGKKDAYILRPVVNVVGFEQGS